MKTRPSPLKRDAALKVLPDGFSNNSDRMARLQREAEVLASLDYPKIGHIHGICESEDAELIRVTPARDVPTAIS